MNGVPLVLGALAGASFMRYMNGSASKRAIGPILMEPSCLFLPFSSITEDDETKTLHAFLAPHQTPAKVEEQLGRLERAARLRGLWSVDIAIVSRGPEGWTPEIVSWFVEKRGYVRNKSHAYGYPVVSKNLTAGSRGRSDERRFDEITNEVLAFIADHELEMPDDGLSTRQWHALEKKTGTKILGLGNTRIVLDLGDDRILKVGYDRFETGIEDNKSEWETWKNANHALRRVLLRPLRVEEYGAWILFPKIETFRKLTARDPAVRRIIDVVEVEADGEEGRPFIDDNDVAGNVGLYKGKLVLFDYGVGGF